MKLTQELLIPDNILPFSLKLCYHNHTLIWKKRV